MSHPGVYASPWRLVLTDTDGHMFASVPFKAADGSNAEQIESPVAAFPMVLKAFVSVPCVGKVDTGQSYALRRGDRLSIDKGALHIDIQESE